MVNEKSESTEKVRIIILFQVRQIGFKCLTNFVNDNPLTELNFK